MMRSMFSGVSGLKTHQTKMDVVGNNIANVNTVGYKRSTVTFNEMLNQQIRGASAPSTSFFGGTNPMQVGLGVSVGSIDVVHSAGSPQSTGRSMDMSIEGEGYFVIGIGSDNYYTRAGNFGFDAENNLVASNGMKVKGWTATIDSDNKLSLDTSQAISPINLTALSTSQIMQATTNMTIGVNLDSRLAGAGASKPATLSWVYAQPIAQETINFSIDGGGAISVTINTTDDITTVISNINTAILASGAVASEEPAGSGKIQIKSSTTGTSSEIIANPTLGNAGLSSSTTVYGALYDTIKSYTSPVVTGQDINDATDTNIVRINIGEGVVVNDDFRIIDGKNTVFLNSTNADKWDLDPSSGLLTIRGDLGVASWDTNANIKVEYHKADYQTSMKVYDNQGGAHDFTVTYMKIDSNHWQANYAIDGDVIGMGTPSSYTKDMFFKTNGQIDDIISGNASFQLPYTFPLGSGLEPLQINVDLSTMIQVANENSTLSNIQNGFSPGSLQRISVNQTGQMIGTFSNGENIELAQVALATFSNTAGLSKVGDTLFIESRNSGIPEIGASGSGGKGSIKPESLEMSNVDLSQEFVDMIITQRGFQANSRIITTSDEMLQELVNLKR
jgi:flagellar hook protein FlgE